MRVNLVPESARHLEMTRARQMRVDTRDLVEAQIRPLIQILFQDTRIQISSPVFTAVFCAIGLYADFEQEQQC